MRPARVTRCPATPSAAPDLPDGVAPASGPRAMRRRLGSGPMAPLKLASGCDRRCSFCAIPSFRGSFVSRRPTRSLDEARWLADQGVRELFLVSENSTSYGKDLGDLRLLETLLPELAAVDGIDAGAGVVPAAGRDAAVAGRGDRARRRAWRRTSTSRSSTRRAPVLRRMRRFGDAERFLDLLDLIRRTPRRQACAATSSSVSRARPSTTSRSLTRLPHRGPARCGRRLRLLRRGRHRGGRPRRPPRRRRDPGPGRDVERLAEELTAQRAEDRVGEQVDVLVESGRRARGRRSSRVSGA